MESHAHYEIKWLVPLARKSFTDCKNTLTVYRENLVSYIILRSVVLLIYSLYDVTYISQ